MPPALIAANVIGTEGRIEIDRVWYEPTSFRVYDSKNNLTREYKSNVVGRGMQFEADEAERLILAGATSGELLPPSETVAIMRALDTIRGQIGLKYPSEKTSRRGKRVSVRSRSSATRKKRPQKSQRA